jgi:hypothetical protein
MAFLQYKAGAIPGKQLKRKVTPQETREWKKQYGPHYLDVDTIFGDLRHECLHQLVVRNTIFRKALPSVVSGYGKRSIN